MTGTKSRTPYLLYGGMYLLDFDFDGYWIDSVSQRCQMSITCQNDIYYYIEIDASDGASLNAHWEILAEYDASQNALVYQNGLCTTQIYSDNGGDMQETIVYSDGEGIFYPKDGKLYWKNWTDPTSSNCIFVR